MTALSGGVGGAKLVLGLSKLLKPGELRVIGNTGDDFRLFGLHISPDLDIVMYTLAGIVDDKKGWGIKNDTFSTLEALNRYYGLEKWFGLGDRDISTHLYRTYLLAQGHKLSEATSRLCLALGVTNAKIIPMTDDQVETKVRIQDGSIINFQEYFVKRGCADSVNGVTYEGSRTARPAKGVLESLRESDLIVICPSNPIASIGPVLATHGIKEALTKTSSPVIAVSPIIGGKPLKGPADKFLKGLGFDVSAVGVGRFYEGIIDYLLLDSADAYLDKEVSSLGISAVPTNTVMNTLEDKIRLARTILRIGSESQL